MNVWFRMVDKAAADARRCHAFIHATRRAAAAFVCIGETGAIVTRGAHRMNVPQLVALARGVLISAAQQAEAFPEETSRAETALIAATLATLDPACKPLEAAR